MHGSTQQEKREKIVRRRKKENNLVKSSTHTEYYRYIDGYTYNSIWILRSGQPLEMNANGPFASDGAV